MIPHRTRRPGTAAAARPNLRLAGQSGGMRRTSAMSNRTGRSSWA